MMKNGHRVNVFTLMMVLCSCWIIAIAGIVTFPEKFAPSNVRESLIGSDLSQTTVNAYNWKGLRTEGHLKYYYEDNTLKSMLGVDVSYFQEEIDWVKVKASGIDFALIQVGYRGSDQGGIYLDPRFEENVNGALAAGIEVGVYFYSQAITEEEAREEAQFVVDNIQGMNITFPVAFDQEEYTYDAARTDNLSNEQITRNAKAFCEVVENAGYKPIIYTNHYWATEVFDLNELRGYDLWYASYQDKPQLSSGYSIWQYTEEGVVDGIGGDHVDINLYFTEARK